MDTPLIISGAGHLGLIMFLLFGGVFTRAPEPEIRSAEVTVMSEEEFAALTRPETGEVEPPPMIEAEEPAAAVDPDAPEDQPPPEQPRTVDPAPRPEPQPVPEPDPEPAPDPAPEPDPEPAPEPDLPQAEESVPDAAPRVAPEPTPEPPVEAETAETPERAVLPDPAERGREGRGDRSRGAARGHHGDRHRGGGADRPRADLLRPSPHPARAARRGPARAGAGAR